MSMAIKPFVLGSASLVSLVIAQPVWAQAAPNSGGIPQDLPEQPSDGTVARQEGDAVTADQAAAPASGAVGEEEIVVTGVRGSIIGAINVKRDATQIVDSIVAEDVGKLPDNNVIEALQRVTGVQVTNRTGGEAAGFSIRGLPDALTTMNGRNIFTASGRSFSLQDIPANLVKRIDVYKTRAAEQIETGLAGQVDVFTRRPFDFDGFAISAVARGIYNEQADTFNPNISALVSDRWETGIGDIGVLVNGSYARTKYRDMTVTAGALVPFAATAIPGNAANTCSPSNPNGWVVLERLQPSDCRAPGQALWQPGTDRGLATAPGSTLLVNGQQTPYYLSRDAVFSSDLTGQRERPAVNAAIQWAPNSSSEYTFEFFWNQFKADTYNSLMFSFVDCCGSLGSNPLSTVGLYDGTNLVKTRTVPGVFGFNSGDYTRSKTDSFVYALNGKWDVGERGKIVADLSYQTSRFDTQFLAMRLNRTASRIDVDFNAGGGIPSYNFNDNALLLDPAQWNVAEFYDNANRSKGSALTFQVDADYSWDEGFIRKVKAGLRYDDRKAADSVRTQDAGVLGVNFATLDRGLQTSNSGFFDGRADVPTSWLNVNGSYLYDNADAIRSLYRARNVGNLRLSDQLALTQVFDINEITMAAYAQADAEVSIFGRPLAIQAGLRYVDVDTDFTFTDRYAVPVLTTGGSQATNRFLPAVTLRYDITSNFRARFNYGQTLRRPGFADLNPNFQLTGDLTNVGYGTGSGGNVNLRSTVSKNYDAALEWYFERNSLIYGTLFRREIDGLVVPITSLVNVENTGLNTNRFLVTRPENASNGVLKGAELGLTYFPTYLPGVLKGLGFVGSLTVLDSRQNIPQVDLNGNVTGQDQSSFFGVSDFSYNVTAAYDRGPIGARLSYVWRKAFLANNEARLFAGPIGVWRRPESSLDFQLTASITPRLGLTFDAVNLTNSKQQTYYKFEDAGNQDQFNLATTLLSRTFAVGLRYSFD